MENIEKMKVRLTFLEPVLGTSTGDRDIYRRYIGAKAPKPETVDDEVEALGVEDQVELVKTIFPKDREGRSFLYDYQIKGFFKGACQALRKVEGTKSASAKAFKKIIDTLIFPGPRQIPIQFEGEIGECQRPLRANTPQGERTAIAISEEIPAGATCEFEVQCLGKGYMDLVKEWLDYGSFFGIGQWRSSGKGRFSWEEI